MEFIKQNDKILLLWDSSFDVAASDFNADSIKANFSANINFENIERLSLASYEDSSFTFIIVKTNDGFDIPFFASLLKLLKPNGRLLAPSKNANELQENLKLAGFINIDTKENDILAEKPNYNVGSAVKLSFGKKASTNNTAAAVWKLTDDGDDNDLINEDDLLDESDKIKPNPTDLKVCGTTGKRKACKDCSCGLAEELAAENGPKAATENAKSSCGSCYLCDAFRCASCPYLGMPAFKPGEKVQLAGGLLKDDL